VAIGATAWLGARLAEGRTGVVAGLALLTSLGFFVYGRYVRPDALFVAALAVGFALALSGVADERRVRVAAGLAAFGLAALAKDPLGALAPPLAIGLALALGERGRPVGRWLPWYGVLFAVLVAFGWWIEAERATPGFVWYTVVDNHLLNVILARPGRPLAGRPPRRALRGAGAGLRGGVDDRRLGVHLAGARRRRRGHAQGDGRRRPTADPTVVRLPPAHRRDVDGAGRRRARA